MKAARIKVQRQSCKVCGYSFTHSRGGSTKRCNSCYFNGYRTSTERRKSIKNGTHLNAELLKRLRYVNN